MHESLKKISIGRGVLFRTVPPIFSSQFGTYGVGKPAVGIGSKYVRDDRRPRDLGRWQVAWQKEGCSGYPSLEPITSCKQY
jgi:hypothetical protein